MNKHEWGAVMAHLVFGLLHTEDTLTLRVAGLMIDPFHKAAPLSFRMGFMLKHLLISQDEPGLARSLLSHILRACEVDQTPQNERGIEDALIQMLYCERTDARNLLASTKKPVKIPLKIQPPIANRPLTQNKGLSITRATAGPSTAAAAPASVKHKVLSKRGRPITRPRFSGEEEEDIEYKPGKT